MVSADRGDSALFPTHVENFYAHDNIVYMNGSAVSGHVRSGDQVEQAAGRTNRFARNTYRVADPAHVWWTWPTVPAATWSDWRAAGQDTDGTIDTW